MRTIRVRRERPVSRSESAVGRCGLRGLLLVNKSVGPTSHDLVDRVRRLFGERKVGHTGTLDPNASGLLVLCVGGATRFAGFLSKQDKVYRAVIRLGETTDTDDTEGEVIARCERGLEELVNRERLLEVLDGFKGQILQVPPSFSSKKIDGVPAYVVARKGGKPSLNPVSVRMDRIDLLEFDPPRLSVEVACSAGTYMRSFARDLGESLGTGGHLEALVRLRVGPFHLEQARSIDEISALEPRDAKGRLLLPVEQGMERMPAATVNESGMEKIYYGRSLDLADNEVSLEGELALGPNEVRIHAADGRFLGVGMLDMIARQAGTLRPRRLMIEAFPV